MTSTLDTTPGPAQRTRTRRFVTAFAVTMAAYVAVLIASLIWGDWQGDDPLRLIWVLAPVVPIIATAVVLVRYIASSDEFEVIQSCKSLAVAFLVTMLAAVVIGFLGFSGIAVPGVGWWIYGIGMFTWLVARIALDLRTNSR